MNEDTTLLTNSRRRSLRERRIEHRDAATRAAGTFFGNLITLLGFPTAPPQPLPIPTARSHHQPRTG